MSNTSCTAFLQSHVGRLPSRAGAAIRLLAGTKIGAWRVTGEGQPGARRDTYPIVHEREGACALMTVFDVPAVALAAYTRRILETAQILTAIDHPGVESIVDAGLVADGRPYVVTEAHRGITLAQRDADEVPIELEDAITILRAICEPLIAAHEMGVVHGSLTLEHVFLVDWDDSRVKLLDWGMERSMFDEARRAGMELPSRVYPIAPEAALGIVSAKLDAYALGVIAHQLLLRCLPYSAETQVALRLVQEQHAPDPRALWPDIPASLESLLCDLLAVDPRARPSLRATAERLAAIANELDEPTISIAAGEVKDAVPADEPPPVAIVAAPVVAPAVVGAAAVTAKVLPLPPPDRVEWKKPFNWRIAAVLTATAASAALTIGVVQRADQLATMAGPRKASVLEPAAIAKSTEPQAATVTPAVTVPSAPAPTTARVASTPQRTPTVAPATPKPEKVATTPPPVKKKPTVRVAPEPSVDAHSNELLTQYQRIGHDLMELRRARATPATAEMWQQFQALKIQPALASANKRASVAATLRDLRAKIERHKGVEISDACRANPLADGCK
jgi:eukaryotic-like serine/threonine-protein kinase